MEQRKIFNFESKILDEETFNSFGYYPDELGKSSAKFVIATCRFCGNKINIRKGFFNKSGSACHKECKYNEMSISGSPFSNIETRKKAKETNLKKWGNEFPQKNELVKKKISNAKAKEDYQNHFKKVMQDRYGVDNPSKLPDHSQKVKNTSIKKYGKSHFSLNEEVILKKTKTNIEKYGCPFPTQNEEVKSKIKNSWTKVVEENDEKYSMVNFVENSEELWLCLKNGMSLSDISFKFGLERVCLNKVLLSNRFKEKYQKVYVYPKRQKQKEVFDCLVSFGLKDVVMDDRLAIGFELDVYSPSKKVAVEFNGSYWHSEAILEPSDARNKHLNKTKMCSRKGIRLIHIFEKQWENRRFQYESFIKSAFGLNCNFVHARSCDIDFSAQYNFMDSFHIQGKPRGVEYWVNLIFKGDIVGSMSFSTHHRQNSSVLELVLSRLAFKSDTTVVGGASRMFSYAKKWAKINGFEKIITWSDEMITEGRVYEKMGFNVERQYGPDYFYWDLKSNSYRSKQSQKKSATGCPKEKTEREWCYENSMYRIWDCGKKRWSFSL